MFAEVFFPEQDVAILAQGTEAVGGTALRVPGRGDLRRAERQAPRQDYLVCREVKYIRKHITRCRARGAMALLL